MRKENWKSKSIFKTTPKSTTHFDLWSYTTGDWVGLSVGGKGALCPRMKGLANRVVESNEKITMNTVLTSWILHSVSAKQLGYKWQQGEYNVNSISMSLPPSNEIKTFESWLCVENFLTSDPLDIRSYLHTTSIYKNSHRSNSSRRMRSFPYYHTEQERELALELVHM